VVEQRTENPRVVSSTLTLGTIKLSGSSSVVERLLAKEKAASSNLVFRSIRFPDYLKYSALSRFFFGSGSSAG
jgi:hypothetical protein